MLLFTVFSSWNLKFRYELCYYSIYRYNCVASGSRNEKSGTRRNGEKKTKLILEHKNHVLQILFIPTYFIISNELKKMEKLKGYAQDRFHWHEYANTLSVRWIEQALAEPKSIPKIPFFFKCPSIHNKCIHWLDNNAYMASHGESILADNQIPYLEFWLLGLGPVLGLSGAWISFFNRKEIKGDDTHDKTGPQYWSFILWTKILSYFFELWR